MPKHVFENSCPFSSIFIYIASITTFQTVVYGPSTSKCETAATTWFITSIELPQNTSVISATAVLIKLNNRIIQDVISETFRHTHDDDLKGV